MAVEITEIKPKSQGEVDSLCSVIRRFMGKFGDSLQETEEAVRNAAQQGFILQAIHGGERVALAVVTRSPFEDFQPSYHLAYICVKPGRSRNGYGRRLIEALRSRIGADFSLHVAPDNDAALAFYRDAGLKVKYLRMMHKEK